MINLLRNCQICFPSDYTILLSHQQSMRAWISPYPDQHALLSVIFAYSHPSGCEVLSHCGLDLIITWRVLNIVVIHDDLGFKKIHLMV